MLVVENDGLNRNNRRINGKSTLDEKILIIYAKFFYTDLKLFKGDSFCEWGLSGNWPLTLRASGKSILTGLKPC